MCGTGTIWRTDPSLTSLRDWELFCVAMVDLDNRMGWDLYINAEN